MTRYYKWMADGEAIYGTCEYAPIGKPQPRIEGFLKMCGRGYHVCTSDQVQYWCGTELWEIEVAEADIVEVAPDKVLCRTWTGIRKLRWTRGDMVDFAKACADRARKYGQISSTAAHATRASAADSVRAANAYAARAAAATAADAADAACTAHANHAARAARGAAHANADAAADAARAAAVHAAACAAGVAERKCQREWIEARVGEKL